MMMPEIVPGEFRRILRNAWQGRVSGCMLGKAVELFSMQDGAEKLSEYLRAAGAEPLRDYVPHVAAHAPDALDVECCGGRFSASRADDDINYSVLALMLLEQHGTALTTADVARAWLRYLPLASTYTAERAAYRTLLARGSEWFPEGADPGFDLAECADNPYNDWIGAQIRADVYGWVCPGNPDLASELVLRDAGLSHRGEGIHGATFVAVLGSLLAGGMALQTAMDEALGFIPADSDCAGAVALGRELAERQDGGERLRAHYAGLSVVHTVNNLALVAWALSHHPEDFSAAVGDVVTAGLDTDCNGATVGGLWALQGSAVPGHWTEAWNGRIGVSLAGVPELALEDLVDRTLAVAVSLSG
jgi:ADP-ribosylglycohydrolase